jgi:hypothetical protein
LRQLNELLFTGSPMMTGKMAQRPKLAVGGAAAGTKRGTTFSYTLFC